MRSNLFVIVGAVCVIGYLMWKKEKDRANAADARAAGVAAHPNPSSDPIEAAKASVDVALAKANQIAAVVRSDPGKGGQDQLRA
jgi:hypothetical protein